MKIVVDGVLLCGGIATPLETTNSRAAMIRMAEVENLALNKVNRKSISLRKEFLTRQT